MPPLLIWGTGLEAWFCKQSWKNKGSGHNFSFLFFSLFLHINHNDDLETRFKCMTMRCGVCTQSPETFPKCSTYKLALFSPLFLSLSTPSHLHLSQSKSDGPQSSLHIWCNPTGLLHCLRKEVIDVVGRVSASWGLTDNSAVSPRASLDPSLLGDCVCVQVSVCIQVEKKLKKKPLYGCILRLLWIARRVVMDSGFLLVHRNTHVCTCLHTHRWIFALGVHIIVFLGNSMQRLLGNAFPKWCSEKTFLFIHIYDASVTLTHSIVFSIQKQSKCRLFFFFLSTLRV